MKLWAGALGRGFGARGGERGKSLAFVLSGHWVESWVAPPDALEEVAQNEIEMDCQEGQIGEAITPVGDRTWSPEEAARNAELALEEAEMAAAEAESGFSGSHLGFLQGKLRNGAGHAHQRSRCLRG